MRKELLGGGVDEPLVEEVAHILKQISNEEANRLIFLAKERDRELKAEAVEAGVIALND